MSNRQLLIGASVPCGLQAIKEFEALKLGEIALIALPDNVQEATEVMRYCRKKGIYVILAEIIHRGCDKRWICPSISKEQFNKILAEGGEYYLGRYTTGEAGGVMYWTKEYTINRAVDNYENLPPAKDTIDARDKYIAYLKPYVDREEHDIANGPLINVDSSMLLKYQLQSGIDHLGLELLPGSPLRMLPAIRGTARAYDDRFWGVHIAFGWYGGFDYDSFWLARAKQTLYLCYLSGAEYIFPESGYYDIKYTGYDFPFKHPQMLAIRRYLREFYRFHKIHRRPGNKPRVRLAVINGNCDGAPGLWNKYAWGQYNNGDQWKDSDAERSWDLTNILTSREMPYTEFYTKTFSSSGQPPCGQYDILPAEAPLDVYQQYTDIVFLGYNLMDKPLYDKLVAYVKNGGNVLMWLPHLNDCPDRAAPLHLFNDGDLTELFGLKVTGSRPADVTGTKNLSGGRLPLPVRPVTRDPMTIGDIHGANVDIVSKDAIVTAVFTGTHYEPTEQLLQRPALIEHHLGKGYARLVPAFDYPGAPGMKEFATLLLRTVSADAQDSLRLACADSVRYAIFDDNGHQVLYALNTEFEVSQNVHVCIDDSKTGETTIPPSTMTFFAIRNGIVLHPEHIETAIESWTDGECLLASPYEQDITVWNLENQPKSVSLNGQTATIPPKGTATFRMPRTPGKIPAEFLAQDYLEEPDINITNCRLPY
ncbi:MAG: hypothetical protein J6X55_17365 [Victivallales bacterium]|nr:hypothetical protein [Victivallales bacterium]